MHATTSPKFVSQQPAVAILAAAVLGIGIALGAVMNLDLGIAPTTASVAAPVTSYEGARARLGYAGAVADSPYYSDEVVRPPLAVDAPDTKFGQSGFLSSVKNGEQVSQPERDGRYGAGYR